MTATQTRTKTPDHILPGQRWTFVHRDGKRTEYVVDHAEFDNAPDAQTNWNWVWLLNPVTEKMAMVSILWLREASTDARGHWEWADA